MSWEPPSQQGAPKTSFLAILAPFWDPIWGPVLAHFGHRFFCVFLICLLDGIFAELGPFGLYFGGLLGDVFGSLFESLRKA